MIEVDLARYRARYRKDPKGYRLWTFSFDGNTDINAYVHFTAAYPKARAAAMDWTLSHGHRTITLEHRGY